MDERRKTVIFRITMTITAIGFLVGMSFIYLMKGSQIDVKTGRCRTVWRIGRESRGFTISVKAPKETAFSKLVIELGLATAGEPEWHYMNGKGWQLGFPFGAYLESGSYGGAAVVLDGYGKWCELGAFTKDEIKEHIPRMLGLMQARKFDELHEYQRQLDDIAATRTLP